MERTSRATPQGGYTIGEKARLAQENQNVVSATDDTYGCIKRVEAERASIQAILSNPARL